MKHIYETFMKHYETFLPKRVTFMFHECFKLNSFKSLKINHLIKWLKTMKHGCFKKCFMKIAYHSFKTPILPDFGAMKHFSGESLKNGIFQKPRLNNLGKTPKKLIPYQ